MGQEAKVRLWHGVNKWLERAQVYLPVVSSCKGRIQIVASLYAYIQVDLQIQLVK